MSALPVARVPRHPARRDGTTPPSPVDEGSFAGRDPSEVASELKLDVRFRLGDAITPIQRAFLDLHGFLVFDRVATEPEVDAILAEVDRIEAELLSTGERAIHGVPTWFGFDADGRDYLFRMGFTSTRSPYLSAFVRDARFDPVRRLIGDDARIGELEKDGVVFNRYLNAPGSLRPDLAWHTDALRDVFYNGRMPGPMLNVGLHFDRIRPEDGGLRLIPGTHTQSAASTLFSKIHFVSNAPDPREIAVETWPGDLTVHDGRAWHRVVGSPATGWASLRRSMYVPYVRDAYAPKDANAPTPLYMRLFDAIVQARARRARAELARRR